VSLNVGRDIPAAGQDNRLSLPDGRKRYHLLTVVKFRHWTGPVYFNVIRPFHHIIVKAMLTDAVKDE
jgi:hypothetical protein